ncbi:transmembrane protein 242 [Biomphalaria glabrata]|nr:transmembrane protein 242-like [Biomphalaria glabrata]
MCTKDQAPAEAALASGPSLLTNTNEHVDDKYQKLKAAIFLTTVTGMSILGGFGTTLAMSKRQDPTNFSKGIHGSREIPESGISLATRALARGSLYSVAGVSFICFAVWKLMGAHDLKEFRHKMGSILPTIPKKPEPGRSEFTTIRDLFNYIIEEDEKEKRTKKQT